MIAERQIAARPSLLVDVVEKGSRGRRGWRRCEIGKNLQFSTESLESYCFAPWQPVIFDALLLAAAVEFCDRARRRSSLSWGRDFRLRLPVHEPGRWNAQAVLSALTNALALVTGDSWSIQFVARNQSAVEPRQGPLCFPVGAHAVIPFSDGLDSRAVAALEACKFGDGLIRVRLGSKAIDRPIVNGRAQPFTCIPYKVLAGDRNFPEASCRSRGFKFALVSGVAAYLARVEEIIVPESGQGALGPVLVPVGQAYPDYRNHPMFTERMERFFASLLGYQVRYRFPRLWHTKGETLKAFVALGEDSDAWMNTRSCWQNRRRVSVDHRQRQCGVCAACLLRRLSIHAAGLNESRDGYVCEDLTATTLEAGVVATFDKLTNSFREYAIAGVLHLDHLAELSNSDAHAQVLKRNASQLSRTLKLVHPEVEARLAGLLRKHKEEWRSFTRSLGSASFIAQWARGSL